mgnify:FL=1
MPSQPNFRGVGANTKYSPSLVDRIIGGFGMGGQAYENVFSGKPIMYGVDEKQQDIEKGIVRDGEGNIIYQEGKKVDPKPKVDPSKVPSFEDVMGMDVKEYLDKVSGIGEKAKNLDMFRSGINTLASSPLYAGQAALDAASNLGTLTGVNLAAMASQNAVMAQNPTKQKIAGKYFR